MMESQVDVLQGKQKALRRYRDALATYSAELHAAAAAAAGRPRPAARPAAPAGIGAGALTIGEGEDGEVPAAVSRLILTAQEDLRRDIARAMHDGPAQSLTNIVLQAQIVDRLVDRDPVLARAEVKALVAMVQTDPRGDQVVHLRRPADGPRRPRPGARRSGGRRANAAGAPRSWSTSIRSGSDRRLPMELESGLFRMIDQALAGYLSTAPAAGRDPARLGRPDRGAHRGPRRRAGGADRGAPADDPTRRHRPPSAR